jgi:hypothetical protein
MFYTERRQSMKQNLKKVTLATSAFAFAALLSLGWSEQGGLSLSIGKAEARVGRPLTPVSAAGVARRHYRRAAVGAAVAVGATGAYYADAGHAGDHYANDTLHGARAAYYGSYASDASHAMTHEPHYALRAYYAGGPWYNYGGWDEYAARNGITCTPGTAVKLDDGLMHVCQ